MAPPSLSGAAFGALILFLSVAAGSWLVLRDVDLPTALTSIDVTSSSFLKAVTAIFGGLGAIVPGFLSIRKQIGEQSRLDAAEKAAMIKLKMPLLIAAFDVQSRLWGFESSAQRDYWVNAGEHEKAYHTLNTT